MAKRNTKEIFFLLSPGASILDSWLPIIKELKEIDREVRIYLVVPNLNIFLQLISNNVLVDILYSLSDGVYIQSPSGKVWFQKNSIVERSGKQRRRLYYKNIIINKLIENPKTTVASLVSQFAKFIIDLKFYSLGAKKIKIEDFWIKANNRVLLYDIHVEEKQAISKLLKNFNFQKKYSICHGIDVGVNMSNKKLFLEKGCPINVLMYSFNEKEYYNDLFGKNDITLSVIGIPRHDDEYISFIKEYKKLDFADEKVMLLISRPSSEFLPYYRKKKAIEEIKQIAIDENFKILIKLHPKEFDSKIYESVLGKDTEGVLWEYTSLHVFQLAERVKFAMTFFSGVAIDLIKLGIPTLEYLNLRGLDDYDNKFSLRDGGVPVFSYRYWGLVAGIDSVDDLRNTVHCIMKNQYKLFDKVKYNYRVNFGSVMPNKLVAEKILNLSNV